MTLNPTSTVQSISHEIISTTARSIITFCLWMAMFVASAFFLFQVCNDDDHENDDEKTVNRGLCSTLIGSATNRDTKEEHIQFKRMHEVSYTSHFGIIRYKVKEYLAIILDQILEKIDLFS